MTATATLVRRRRPLPVLVAAPAATVAALAVLVSCTWWLLGSGEPEVLVHPAGRTVLALLLLVGAVRLWTGRSWLAVAVPAAVCAGLAGWWSGPAVRRWTSPGASRPTG
ncbi:hypothetical protein [Modestobacter versicolor]|uniref:Uncharacterized protein n=1 Tax=Modestobacter versicolor TaxID=429133 RepID=A0A323VAI1_9ACTN|nr:hypothetical protein [Modestobacter versicolor]MBB3675570.1 hypothetical protein [Modestobacter versicolor]PZA20236.1 hypothetical protein DMO24_16505 [Modestobacter versicolor]